MKHILTLLCFIFICITAPLFGADFKVNTEGFFNSYAIHGYDTVAYFTEGEAVKGDKAFVVVWQDEEWLFASQENATLFSDNPTHYAPQYGGYCAYAAGHNELVDIDPDAFSIVGGKLYLNYSHRIAKRWKKNLTEFIKTADLNWPTLGSINEE
jgi:YHS domain-containing protein